MTKAQNDAPSVLHRILLVSPLYPPQTGGTATFTSELAHFMISAAGVSSFIVVTTFRKVPSIKRNADGVLVLSLLFSPHLRGGMPRFVSQMMTEFNLLSGWVIGFLLSVLIRPTIVHVVAKYEFRFFVAAARLLNRKIIIDARDMGSPLLELRGDAFVTCSDNAGQLAREKRSNPGESIHVIPVPMALAPFESLPVVCSESVVSNYLPFILFASEVRTEKGVFELVEAFERLKSNHLVDYKLLLAGQIIDPPPQHDRIHYLGPVPHATMLTYMACADLIVLPSHSDSMPRVCLEAFALHRKVICPPGIREFDQLPEEFVFKEIAVDEIEKKIIAALESDSYPEYDVATHNPDKVFTSYLSIYDNVQNTGS